MYSIKRIAVNHLALSEVAFIEHVEICIHTLSIRSIYRIDVFQLIEIFTVWSF